MTKDNFERFIKMKHGSYFLTVLLASMQDMELALIEDRNALYSSLEEVRNRNKIAKSAVNRKINNIRQCIELTKEAIRISRCQN